MPRPTPQPTEAVNADSFLDIVASVVSIMIILVVMEGIRVKNAPVDPQLVRAAMKTDRRLEKTQAAEQSVRAEVLALSQQVQSVEKEAKLNGLKRDILATGVSALEHKIQEYRQSMDTRTRADFDLRRNLAESRVRLQQLDRQRVQAETAQPEPIRVESYPTPLSQRVEGEEAHFQLRGGLVKYIPLEALIERFRADARRKVEKLRDEPEWTDTVGPEGGFRLRYTLERHDVPPELAGSTGPGGSYARLKRWTLVPTADELGETAEAALAEGSQFREALGKLRPGRHTVTIWTYADSFGSFRQLRKDLYRLGFSVAARPLPLDAPISGSPAGTKSAAE